MGDTSHLLFLESTHILHFKELAPLHSCLYPLMAAPRDQEMSCHGGFLAHIAHPLAWHQPGTLVVGQGQCATQTCSENSLPHGQAPTADVGPTFQQSWGCYRFFSCRHPRVFGPPAFCELLSKATQNSNIRRCPSLGPSVRGGGALGLPGGTKEAKVMH